MKIVNRKQFLQFPAGILYTKFDPFIFEDICIKSDSLTNDWYYQNLLEIEADDSGERFNILDSAVEKGTSFTLDLECEGRDGFYDNDQLFAVFEKKDVEQLVKRLNETISNYPEI